MKDITELSVFETRLYRPDVIPFRQLITASTLKDFLQPYSFKDVGLIEDENKNVVALQMKLGEFRHDKRNFPVDVLQIEKAKISIQISGGSDVAEKFYQKIARSLSTIDPHGKFKKSKPSIKTTLTTCAATLDFEYKEIFSRKMNRFINKDASSFCSTTIDDVAKIQILPNNLTFDVQYTIKDKSLKESSVGIRSKKIVIEPRAGSNLAERRFFISTPTDSQTHMQLISTLEQYFKTTK